MTGHVAGHVTGQTRFGHVTFPRSRASEVPESRFVTSTVPSNFTRIARGLAREIEAEQSRWHEPLEVEEMHVNKNWLTQQARERKAIPGRC